MKTTFFPAVLGLLLCLSSKAQVSFGFREYDWVETKTCKVCQPCQDSNHNKTEVQKNISFYCDEKIAGVWTIHKASSAACDSIYYRISSFGGEPNAASNEEEVLKNICKQAAGLCPYGEIPSSLGYEGGYTSRLLAFLKSEYDKAPEEKDSLDIESETANMKLVEVVPLFPGCDLPDMSYEQKRQCSDMKMLEFIYKNIDYPKIAVEQGVEGIVVLTFVVEKNGTISDAQIIRDIGAGCGQEGLRVVELMNKKKINWTPGKQKGRTVRVQYNLPIKFKLG